MPYRGKADNILQVMLFLQPRMRKRQIVATPSAATTSSRPATSRSNSMTDFEQIGRSILTKMLMILRLPFQFANDTLLQIRIDEHDVGRIAANGRQITVRPIRRSLVDNSGHAAAPSGRLREWRSKNAPHRVHVRLDISVGLGLCRADQQCITEIRVIRSKIIATEYVICCQGLEHRRNRSVEPQGNFVKARSLEQAVDPVNRCQAVDETRCVVRRAGGNGCNPPLPSNDM